MICLLASTAFAAPCRDAQNMDILVDDGLQRLLDIVLGAAVQQDQDWLVANVPVTAQLAEAALLNGLYQQALVMNSANGYMSNADMQACLLAMFTTPAVFPMQALCEGVNAAVDGLIFNPSVLALNPWVGCYVYAASFDGTDAALKCDLYLCYDGLSERAELLPEESVTWLCNAEVSVRFAPGTAYGYTVNSFSLSSVYMDGLLTLWRMEDNTEYEYSVNLPSIMGLAEDQYKVRVWQTSAGEATLTITALDGPGSYTQLLSRALIDGIVEERREFNYFSVTTADSYTLYVVPEGLSWYYQVRLVYPAELSAEFLLYAEFIRNSFSVWGSSNG